MKHVKISYFEFIALFYLAILLLLFTSSQAFYSSSTLALDKDIFNKKLQSSPENTTLVGTRTQVIDLNKLIFSNPFYLSNDTLTLDKILLLENSSATTNREVQFFFERGHINASLVTYNVGYYMEDPTFSGSSSESNSLRNSHEAGSGWNYAKGSGIFLTENGDIINWDAFDQIIKNQKILFFMQGLYSSLLLIPTIMHYLFSQIKWDCVNFISILIIPRLSISLSILILIPPLLQSPPIEPFGYGHTRISNYAKIELKANKFLLLMKD